MGFLAPWFLGGMLAVGVPIFVHLLRRQTTTPRPFSSLMFFERGTQSSTRHRRLRYLVLFALRTAVVVLLVLAFANPYIRRASAGANGKLLLIVIDNSFSMRAGKPQSHLEDAKKAALEVLASRRGGQRAQIMTLGSQLQVLTQPIQDQEALRTALLSVEPGDTHGSFGELGRDIRTLSESVHTPVELHLFSDVQKSNMPGNFADMVLPGNVTLVLHASADAQAPAPNWTVESVDAPAQLADPKDKRRSRVTAVIAGYNTPAATRTASLMVDGRVIATGRVDIPASGRAKVEFAPLDVPYGFSRSQVRIDSADDFPADDASLFVVRRSDPERVLFVHESSDSRSPLYFGAALTAAAPASFVLQTVNAEQTGDVDPSKYAFVVLSDAMALPSVFENALLHNVRSGGNVLITTGIAASHRARIPIFGGTVSDTRLYSREGSFARVGTVESNHPAMAAHNSGDAYATAGADWSDTRFFYAAVVDPSTARVVLRLSDGTPLLLDKQLGEGHVLLLTSGLDNVTNDMPLHPAFIPFVAQAAGYLSGNEALSGSRLVDSFVQLRTSATAAAVGGNGVEVVGPDGDRPLSLGEASTMQSYQLKRAGFYQVRYANGRNALVGVNADRRESDLAPIPQDVLRLWSGAGADAPPDPDTGAAAQSARKPYSLWWYAMLLALALAIAESIVSSFYLGVQREDA